MYTIKTKIGPTVKIPLDILEYYASNTYSIQQMILFLFHEYRISEKSIKYL